MRDPHALTRLLRKWKLEHHRKAIEAALIPAVKQSYGWRPSPPVSTGVSKFGGLPDLHWSEPWPDSEGRPLHFLAQLRLSDLKKHAPKGLLPAVGRLTLWYDSLGEKNRQERTHISLENVEPSLLHLRFDPDEKRLLQPRPWPLHSERFRHSTMDDWGPYPETPIRYEPMRTLEQASFKAICRAEEERDAGEGWNRAYEFLRELEGAGNRYHGQHRLLGDVLEMQGDTRFTAACTAAGVSEFAPRTPKQEKRLRAEARKYQLLIMLDSDDRGPGFGWGDGGSLQWWIRADDLRAGRLQAAVGVFDQGS